MCGRYTLSKPGRDILDALDLEVAPEFSPRYNIAPTQEALVVRGGEHRRRAEPAAWGFRSETARGKRLLINARSETVAEKPSFRDSYSRRRCLVPADGFYEWRAERGRRLPHHFSAADGRLLTFGGLWKPTLDAAGEPGLVFTILTVPANDLVATVHPRMPLILPAGARRRWLDDTTGRAELDSLLTPWAAAQMECRPVSTAVNDVACDSPACLAPPEPPAVEQLDLLT